MSDTFNVLQPEFFMRVEGETNTAADVIFEPLGQGYGHTVGNALRRVLLTSLPGAAIASYQVEGTQHQYDTLEGITEDVFEIGLNLKQVRIRHTAGESASCTLSVNGPATVTAGDIQMGAGFEVTNAEQHIATVADGATLEIDMTVAVGVGYQTASEKKTTTVGLIPLDTLYSPVETVSYSVEATRVGSRTDFDKLILSITTDGSITPTQAVKQAGEILVSHFSMVVNPAEKVEEVQEETLSPDEAETMRLTVEELDLPTRIANALRKGGYTTVDDLRTAQPEEIAKVKNLGEKSVDVIAEALEKKGVTLLGE
ncbi:MAG: DNA-directed RNA polymerase subunit alpha [Pseudomonadales bacterium]|nr:DNA-directed RNA polymerase subunit alpha [Candidatus Woesebacteria bacterium]MCB9801732.1 DNA-directed RNA polymerase subunit alpha [Pseudomonadales bacterium]